MFDEAVAVTAFRAGAAAPSAGPCAAAPNWPPRPGVDHAGRAAAAEHVHVERRSHPSGEFEILLGAQVDLFATGPVPSAEPLFDRLLAALDEEPLSRAVHALRFFTAHQGGRMLTNEVFRDGEPWAAGMRVTAAAEPPLPTGPVGMRVFAFLAPVEETESDTTPSSR
ncbi:DUF6348 family protein [Actinoplanes teichomyceticus]|uniref:Uncharacterized protein n=1 Tax=Actinoplanes teichomyceticus TaxID=1867 RepID=A0A561WAH7_ACTTI|nr:DUF6348 family protein [Actinoplanes teichomyceticus]TWG20863.1 hypothetical protein FHX34_103392 [Actinoplanes teichomyceticus]GIF14524.1 hypothetical protein Ate01nite_45560 [Actinoplanes teichomyceticus]